MSNEVEIGNKKINEGTKIGLSLGLLLKIASGLFIVASLIFTYGYININDKIDEKINAIEENVGENMESLVEDIDNMAEDLEESKDDISDIKGDVKVILDRTSGAREEDDLPTINEPNLPPSE